MRFVIFGLTVSSSWGNGHATLWRGLIRGLGALGHCVTFFERDQPYYARHRDLHALSDQHQLVLYAAWQDVRGRARRAVDNADVAVVTSYCPDAAEAATLVLESESVVRAFYDMDSPITLARLASGESVDYLPPGGLGGFDIVFSYAGGPTVEALRTCLGAKVVVPIYGSVDPDLYAPVPHVAEFASDLSHLGTYAADRREALERLFLATADARPGQRFLLGGPQYPVDFPWRPNVFYRAHVAPAEHCAFYSSSAFTLNVTRAAMARAGYCPSGRLFEAAACEVPILTDRWPGLDGFFKPGEEILAVGSTEDVLSALGLSDAQRRAIAARARARTLDEHSAVVRAGELAHACVCIPPRQAAGTGG